jgi:hypothetical protein
MVSDEVILKMRIFAVLLMGAALGAGVTACAPTATAQVGVEVGVAPECPYGYYDVAPYACAPAGYYGPEWFNGGIFIGAGPWFHGPEHFHGNVDNHFDRQHYHGNFPHAGDKAEEGHRVDSAHFHGNEMRDGHGHKVKR